MMPDNACTDPDQGRYLAAYELGLLDSGQRAAFEKHLSHCSACLDHLYEMVAVSSTMRREPGKIVDRLREIAPARDVDGERREVPLRGWIDSLRDMFRWRIVAPAAAAVAIVLFLVVQTEWQPQDELMRLARIEPVPYVPIEVRAGGASDRSRLYQDGMLLYAEGRYAAAARSLAEAVVLEESGAEWDKMDQARFFLGLSFLMEGDPESARIHLEASGRSSLPVVADRSRWYLAQAYLLLNDPAGALGHLDVLVESSPVYGERAATLRDEIREIVDPDDVSSGPSE